MAYKQPVGVSAAVLGNEPNVGVKGLRSRQDRTDAVHVLENPQDTMTQADKQSNAWGSEDEAELTRKFNNWKAARARQHQERNNVLNLKDSIKAIMVVVLFRGLLHKTGLSVRRIGIPIAAFLVFRGLLGMKAPQKTFPPNDVPYIPFLGQIKTISMMLSEGAALMQVRRGKARNFTSDEMCVIGIPREITLMDPRDREYVLKTNWKNYLKNNADGTGFQQAFAEVMGRGIFAVDGDEWQDHRKVASHMFSANGLRNKMESSFTAHGKKLVGLLEGKAEAGTILDFQDVMSSLTFDTISDIAFGVEPGALEAGIINGKKIDFLMRFDRIQVNSVLRLLLPPIIWKTLRYLNLGFERTIREDAEILESAIKEMIWKRRASQNFESADDLLAMYVRTGRSSGKMYMMDDDYLMETVLNFMVAGRDTTSCTLTNLFKLISLNPEVETKMLEELDSVVGKGNAVSWEHIRDLRYSGAVFNETLRLYPPVAADFRSALQDDILPSGIHIEASHRVTILNAAIGRDPHLWNEPDRFMPERWLQDGKATRRPDEYVFPVFWGGPRLCLGKDMARLETLSIAYGLLSKYRIEVLPHSEKPVNGPVQFYEKGLPVRIHLRASGMI